MLFVQPINIRDAKDFVKQYHRHNIPPVGGKFAISCYDEERLLLLRRKAVGMKHLGDVCKINGANIDPVDVVTFGAPCQDLSIAGKRTGMKHTSLGDEETTRSGLFFESIRIIKELRKADELRNGATNIRPRFAVYENVPGAFSSNKGEDFRAVLEETARVIEKDAIIPRPPNGKWTTSGCIMGNGWSITWRVLDAQFWGVPQRRRRIALIADFGGHTAPEILFKSESNYRDIK